MKNQLRIVALVAVCSLCSRAHADWPMARHDPQRTGQAQGQSNITEPVPYWRLYLGGAIGSTGMRAVDIDGDGLAEIVIVSGGRILAKRPSDAEIWATAPRDIQSIVGIADLDGDGVDELIVRSLDHVFVYSLQTGAQLWVENDGDMGTIGTVRMADLTGDGAPELIIVECGCCSVNSGNTGFVYTFANSIATPTLLWTPATGSCGGHFSLTVVDADGVAPPEVMLGTPGQLSLYDGQTGALIGQSPPLGTWVMRHQCTPANVDGVPGDEVVCIQDSSLAPSTNQRRVTVMRLQAPATFDVLWTQSLAPDVGGKVAYADPVQDLDGDGAVEIVVAGQDGLGVWTTHVFDGATGQDLGTVAGEFPVGAAAVEELGKKLLFTTDESSLTAWRFDRTASPTLSSPWALQDREVLHYSDETLRSVGTLDERLVTLDLSGDGIDELLTVERSTNNFVIAYRATGGAPVEHAARGLPPDTGVLHAWAVPPTTRPAEQLAVAQDNGFLLVLDDQLQPTNSGGDDVIGPGIRIGGYYAPGRWGDLRHTPVVTAIDGFANETILLPNSQNALLALNAAQSSQASPPRPSWRSTHTFAPTVVDGLVNGGPGLACVAEKWPPTTPPSFETKVLRPDGSFVWAVPIERNPLNDLVPGTFDGDGVRDLVIHWGAPDDTLLRTRAISGATGATIWNSIPVEPGAGRQPAGLAIDAWDTDGFDDVVYQAAATRVLSGMNGAELASLAGPAYFMPIIYDVAGDPLTEIILHAGVAQPRLLSHDLSATLYISPEADKAVPYGSVAECGARRVLITGSWLHPPRLKITDLSGPQLGNEQTLVLAEGTLYATETDAINSGAWLGQLTPANTHQNLTGAGSPSVVVGSSDGWLYAVNPCTAALDFSLPFGAAVGEAVFGDTDGDGIDEIIVTASDGYLYLVKNEAIAKPALVDDIDPGAGIVDIDVDIITTTDALAAKWTPVTNAIGYEVAIVDANGAHIAVPAWQAVGLVTQTQVTGLPLTDYGYYRFAVRALSAEGPSVDAISDGVTVRHPPAPVDAGMPDAGPEPTVGKCNCEIGNSRSPAGTAAPLALLFGLAVLAARRKRRHKRAV